MSANGKAIDQLRATFSKHLREYVVPTSGVSLFFGPLTVGDVQDANKRKPVDDWERHMFLLVSAARDAEGKPVFSVTDIPALSRDVPLDVITEIVEFMYQGIPDIKAAERELKEDPPLASA